MATRIAKTPVVKKVTPRKTATPKRIASKSAPTERKVTSEGFDSRVFAYPIKDALLTQVLHVYRDNSHQDTSKVKTRGELTKTTKKMYKQKGTGNARHGSRMSPTFVGGGVAFGPTGVKPGNLKLNKKMRAAALAGVLTLYHKDNQLELVTVPEVATPSASAVKSLFTKDKTLLVYHQETPAFLASVKNLGNLSLVSAGQLNAMNVIASRFVAFTPKSLTALVARVAPLLKTAKSK